MTDCRSVESMDKDEWMYEEACLTKIGEQICENAPDHKFVFYEDSKGRHWYRTFIHTDIGWVSQQMAVFGKKLTKRKRPV